MTYNNYLKHYIPVDWEIKKLSLLGTIVSGGTPSTNKPEYYSTDGIAWITPNDLSNNTGNIFIDHGERDVTQKGIANSSATLMPPGSILLSTRAPIGYIAISETEVCTNQGFKSIVPDKGYDTAYIYLTLLNMMPHIHHLGVGTTFKEVSKDAISSLLVLYPPKEIVNQFSVITEPLLRKCSYCQKENKKLSALRDWLLPMLMNGQATVSN